MRGMRPVKLMCHLLLNVVSKSELPVIGRGRAGGWSVEGVGCNSWRVAEVRDAR